MIEEPVTINLGDEYDNDLRKALREVLTEIGATGIYKSWGVGGSQEIETFEVTVNNNLVTIESETYIGLTITGPKRIIEHITRLVRQRKGFK